MSEVASAGGFVREYLVELDPDAMRAADVTLDQIYRAIGDSNLDVSAGTLEHSGVEYLIRGLGFIDKADDLRKAVVVERKNTPITIEQIGRVTLGPAPRRGALDKGGAEAVGGVVTARYDANPLEVLQSVHRAVDGLEPGLPRKAVIDWSKVKREEVVAFAEREGINAFSDAAPASRFTTTPGSTGSTRTIASCGHSGSPPASSPSCRSTTAAG